jgi:mycothiol system anti-sigma-R factor
LTAVFQCAEVERFVDAWLDGEFAPEDRVELERHVAACADCAKRVRFQSEFKRALRAAVPRPKAPADLRARLAAALDREPAPNQRWRRTAWKVAPAAAAVVLLGTFVLSTHPFSPVVEDAVAKFQRDLPVEVTGPDDHVRAWFANKVDFAVRPPRLPANARFVGARLANVRDRQAAYLLYDVNGEKVAVLVFDPNEIPMEARRRRYVGNHDVYLDGQRGHHVALVRDRDVGYAFTSDMDEDQMIQLVSTAIQH